MGRIIILLFALAGTVHAAGTVYSAVLAGSGEDYASAVMFDSGGNTYVAGLTYSPDFPVTPEAFQTPRAASVIRMPSSPSSDRPETSSGQPISTA
jgi:hypothetical protein